MMPVRGVRDEDDDKKKGTKIAEALWLEDAHDVVICCCCCCCSDGGGGW